MADAPPPVETALIVPVPAADRVVGEHRDRLDPGADKGVPAHVTVLYPFLEPSAIDQHVLAALAAAVTSVGAFDTRFARTRWFGQSVLWLEPEPAQPFQQLTAAVWRAFPQHPPYRGAHADVIPHLTVADSSPAQLAEMRAAERAVQRALPVFSRVERVLLVAGADTPRSWRVQQEFTLPGAAGPSGAGQRQANPAGRRGVARRPGEPATYPPPVTSPTSQPDLAGQGVEEALRSTRDTYDVIAAAYAARASITPALAAHLERFVAAVPVHGLVLDAGCGPGHLAAVLAQRGLRAVALDASHEMLRLAQRHVPAVGGDLRRLPLANGSLHGLWSCASLLHVSREQVPATLRGWWTALRPGGVLGLSTAIGGDDEQGWEQVPYAAGSQPYDAPLRRWFVYHSSERLQALLADAGFDILEAEVHESHRIWLRLLARAH